MKPKNIYLRNGASSQVVPSLRRNGLFSAILVLMVSMLIGIISLGGVTSVSSDSSSNSSTTANAGFMGFLCDGLGTSMNDKDGWKGIWNSYPAMDLQGRQWTLQEAFGRNVQMTNYFGEGGKDTFLVKEAPEGRYNGVGNIDKQKDKVTKLRSFGTCSLGSVMTHTANLVFMGTNMISSLSQSAATFAFNPKIVCSSADDAQNDGACINILKIVGGDGGDSKGIIGALTTGLYGPLIAIFVTIVGVAVGYRAFKERSWTQTLPKLAWVFLSVIAGYAILSFPATVAKIPMSINNTVVSCVAGSFNGNNCLTGDASPSQEVSTPGKICNSNTAGVPTDQRLTMTVNGLSCQIWKAFVLEPYSQASFGRSYSEMETSNKDISEAIKKAGLRESDFSVGLGSTKSGKQMENGTLELNSTDRPVSNLVAYQMYLETNASQGDPAMKTPDGFDKKWYRIVGVAANNDAIWNSWTWSSGGFMRLPTAMLALFTASLGSLIILVVSITSLMYFIISSIIIALAPIFLLLAVHPTRGKRLFLGWLSQVVGNIYKYIVSALFLMLTVILYGGVLGTISNIATAFIVVLILTLALLLYRNEILGLVGKVNMGGERLGSNVSGFFDRTKKTAADVTRKSVGGGIGAVASQGSGNPLDVAKSFAKGASHGVTSRVSNSNSVVGAAARSYNAGISDNKRDLSEEARNMSRRANSLETGAREDLQEFEEVKMPAVGLAKKHEQLSDERDDILGEINNRNELEETVRIQFEQASASNGIDPEMAAAFAGMKTLEEQMAQAKGMGDSERYDQLSSDLNKAQVEFGDNFHSSLSDRLSMDHSYDSIKKSVLAGNGVSAAPNYAKLKLLSRDLELTEKDYAEAVKRVNTVGAKAEASNYEYRKARTSADLMSQGHMDLRPGDRFTAARRAQFTNAVRDQTAEIGMDYMDQSEGDFSLPEDIKEASKAEDISPIGTNQNIAPIPSVRNSRNGVNPSRQRKPRETMQDRVSNAEPVIKVETPEEKEKRLQGKAERKQKREASRFRSNPDKKSETVSEDSVDTSSPVEPKEAPKRKVDSSEQLTEEIIPVAPKREKVRVDDKHQEQPTTRREERKVADSNSRAEEKRRRPSGSTPFTSREPENPTVEKDQPTQRIFREKPSESKTTEPTIQRENARENLRTRRRIRGTNPSNREKNSDSNE